MKEYQVLITRPALSDIEDIFKYIAIDLNEPSVASKMKEAILGCVDSLALFPERNRIIDDELFISKSIRKASIRNYFVIYTITDDTVLILRVLYNRRDWQNII